MNRSSTENPRAMKSCSMASVGLPLGRKLARANELISRALYVGSTEMEGRKGGRDGGREGGREEGREGGREGGMEEGREGGKKRGRREGGREGGKEEEGREGYVGTLYTLLAVYSHNGVLFK